MTTLFVPGTAEFRELHPRDQYKATVECLALEYQKPQPNLGFIADLKKAEHYCRAKASLLDPMWDFEHNFTLADKNTTLTLLKPWPAQELIVRKYEEALRLRKPLRLLLPKSRQHGVSQIIAALIYRHVRNSEHFNSLVMAHELQAAKTIFKKYSTFHRYDPFQPATVVGTVDEMIFAKGGKIAVRTASGKMGHVARGDTLHAVHFSEAAFYPDGAYDIYNAIMSAIVSGGADRWSMVFLESTGNGQQGIFYDMCMRWQHARDEQQWDLLFLPWTDRFDAWLPIASEEERQKILGDLSDEEKLLMSDAYGATVEQIKWRRETIRNTEGADSGERLRKFRQEHPKDLEECFQAYGGSVFNEQYIKQQIDVTKLLDVTPKSAPKRCDIKAESALYSWDGDRRKHIHDTPRPYVKEMADGPLMLWPVELPDGTWRTGPVKGREYCIGVDIAQGTLKGDYSVAVVFDRTSRQIVARYRAKIAPELFVNPVRLLSLYFNNAKLNVETNFYGTFTNWLADTDRQPFLHIARNPNQTNLADGWKQEYGWRTTETSKRHLISVLRRALEEEARIFRDADCLREMLIFKEELSAKGQITFKGAPSDGKQHDDIVIATALALVCDEDSDMPAKPEFNRPWRPLTIPERWKAIKERQSDQPRTEDEWQPQF